MNDQTGMKWSFSMILPLLIYYAVDFVVSIFASAWIMAENYSKIILLWNKTDKTEFYDYIMGKIMPYSTQITAIVCLITIPILLILLFRNYKKEKQADAWQQKPAEIWKYLAIVVASIAASITVNNLLTLSNIAFSSPSYQATSKVLYSPGFITQIICIGCIVPIAEELIFRGLCYRIMRQQMPPTIAIILSALFFGFYHGNIVQGIYGFVLGMFLAYFHERYGSVKAPILAHMIMNLTSIVGTHFNFYGWMLENPFLMGALTVGGAALTSVMYLFIREIGEWYNLGTMVKERPQDSNKR